MSEQQAHLGEDGRATCAQALEDARREHDREIPRQIIESFPVPDLERISWIDVQSAQETKRQPAHRCCTYATSDMTEMKTTTELARAHSLQSAQGTSDGISGDEELAQHIASDGTPLPFFVQYDQIKVCSSFARAYGASLDFLSSVVQVRDA